MKNFLFLAVLVVVCGCQSKSVSTKAAALNGYPQNVGAAPLLTGGASRSAVYSLDGSKIYFISKNRRDHRNSQVYEYDIGNLSERRVTFQDGEVLSVAGGPEQKIFYASTTDEIKEQPFVKDTDPNFPRAEIYYSDPFGDQIERLTETPGFDGEMIYVDSKKSLLFTSSRGGLPGIYWFHPEKGVTPFQVGSKSARSAALSPDGKYVYWVEEDVGAESGASGTAPAVGSAAGSVSASASVANRSQLIVRSTLLGKDRIALLSVPGVVKSLSVNALGLVAYAWQPRSSSYTQIDLYNPESSCNRVLLKSKMDFMEPQFSRKSPQVLLFRGSLEENSVVYRWELPEALGPCVR